MDRQTVALLGGTGFIGSRLVNALIESGKQVRIGTRRRDHARHLQMLPVEIVELEALDTRTLARFVAGAHAAINLVGVLHGGRGIRPASSARTSRCRPRSRPPAPRWACSACCT